MRLRLALVVAALALVALPALALAAFRQFIMPSRNIACGGDGHFLRCDVPTTRGSRRRSPARASSTGTVDLGTHPPGPREVPVRLGPMFNHHVLKYGRTWRNGGFRCTSRVTGLTCRNAARHGFQVSREKLTRF